MTDQPAVPDLAAHAVHITRRRDQLREAMAQVAAENANPVPLTPEPPSAA